MPKQLLILLSLISIVRCAHVCKEDGQFPNPDDRTSYIECIDGKDYFRRCSRTSDGNSYMVFDGRQCTDPPGFVRGFTCPQPSGYFRYIADDKQYYECVDNNPVLRHCPDNTVFDGLECTQPTGPVGPDVAPEFVAPIPEYRCPRVNGVFANPTDRYRYTYYECANGVPTKRNCPSYSNYRDGRYHQDRMIFDGQSCVKITRSPEFIDNRKPVLVDNRNPEVYVDNRVPEALQRRQAVVPDYRCPAVDGLFLAGSQTNTWYECEGGAPKRVYTCDEGLTLDTVTRTCRGTRITDEEVIVHRPETVPVESNPIVIDLARTVTEEPARYYPDQNYYGRRYRRNGRVEFEDQYTGAIIVDTWNEGAWRWDRNPNGHRLPLPLVNDWRPYDYYRTRVAGSPDAVVEYRRPAEEYRRPRVQYVYRPIYNDRVYRE